MLTKKLIGDSYEYFVLVDLLLIISFNLSVNSSILLSFSCLLCSLVFTRIGS